MSVDALLCWWHQRAECHILCRWDWAAERGLVANTIEKCKHTKGRERQINTSSLGLINYPQKETEVWGHQRNLIRTRFITQSLHHHPSLSTLSSVSYPCLSLSVPTLTQYLFNRSRKKTTVRECHVSNKCHIIKSNGIKSVFMIYTNSRIYWPSEGSAVDGEAHSELRPGQRCLSHVNKCQKCLVKSNVLHFYGCLSGAFKLWAP